MNRAFSARLTNKPRRPGALPQAEMIAPLARNKISAATNACGLDQALAAASASTKVNWAPEPMVHDAQSLFPPEQAQFLAVTQREGKDKTLRQTIARILSADIRAHPLNGCHPL